MDDKFLEGLKDEVKSAETRDLSEARLELSALERGSLEDTLELAREDRVEEVARLELLEERATVERIREVVGQLELRRVVEKRVEHIPVELVSEYLVLEHVTDLTGVAQPALTLELDGQTVTLEPGQSYRFELYREAARVGKFAEVVEQVRLGKRTVRETQEVALELGRERLVIESAGDVVEYTESASASAGVGDGTAGSTVPGDRSSLPASGLT